MAKLEQITELLVNEIRGFERGIKRLERLNEGLRDTTVQMDLTELKSILEKHQNEMAEHQNAIRQFGNAFESGVKQIKAYFIWLIVVCVFCLVFSVVLVVVVL